MTEARARQLLQQPLKFGDPEQIEAIAVLSGERPGSWDGRWVGQQCQVCGWWSNGRDLLEADEINEAHRRGHPNYQPRPSLPEALEEIERRRIEEHSRHACDPGPCQCICGCTVEIPCRLLLGEDLCMDCAIRELRDAQHGRRPNHETHHPAP